MLVERFSLLLIINSCKDLLITIGIAAFSLHWREEHHILANKFKQNLTESNFASAVPRDTRKKKSKFVLVCLYVPWNESNPWTAAVGLNQTSEPKIQHGKLTEDDCNPTAASLDQPRPKQHPMKRAKRALQTVDKTFHTPQWEETRPQLKMSEETKFRGHQQTLCNCAAAAIRAMRAPVRPQCPNVVVGIIATATISL